MTICQRIEDCNSLTLFSLGRGPIEPPRPKKIFIFKWLMQRLCNSMTLTKNIRGSFWPNLRVISIFLNFYRCSKSKWDPNKNGKKNRLFKFWKLISQKQLKLWPKLFRGNVRHKMDHLLVPSENFCDFSKIRKLSLKISLFWPKDRGFPWITKTLFDWSF